MKALGRIVFIVFVPFCLGWVLFAPQFRGLQRAPNHTPATIGVESSTSEHGNTAAIPARPAGPDIEAAQPDASQSETDLYGNDVSDAVAEYGLDAAGSLYEMHAPQVELPHLGSPKS